jgi:rRNA processing protein Gar1
LKNWVKLNLYYLGKSKKHQIFRFKRWDSSLEKVLKHTVFNEKYEEIGYIKEIFGPVKLPFISIKTLPGHVFNPDDVLYAKFR